MADHEIEVLPGPMSSRVPVPMPRTLEQQLHLATVLLKGGAVPTHFKTAEAVVMAIQSGAELGIPPVQSLRLHNLIQGKMALNADGHVAVILASGKAEYFAPEEITEERATFVTKRKGSPSPVRYCFTMADAKLAGLVDKNPTYKTHPKRMLAARAKAFLGRDVYPDVVGGMLSAEELEDLEPEKPAKPAIVMPERIADGTAEPPQQGAEPEATNGTGEYLNDKERQELNKLCNSVGMSHATVRTWLKGQGVEDALHIPRELKERAEKFIRGDVQDERLPGMADA